MIREIKHYIYHLDILRHSVTKVRVKGKETDGAKFVYTRVLEGGAKCSVGIVVMGKLGGMLVKSV